MIAFDADPNIGTDDTDCSYANCVHLVATTATAISTIAAEKRRPLEPVGWGAEYCVVDVCTNTRPNVETFIDRAQRKHAWPGLLEQHKRNTAKVRHGFCPVIC